MSGEVAKPGQLGSGGDGTDAGMFNAPPKCWGCSKPIDGGSAIQFADGVWHIDCFQCTTCGKVIEFDSNLLFLADGKPICPECSYCCSLCKKPIFDEAIVTVEGTYHSECFRCTNCKQRIQGKSFAKTSQGVIYCVNCYADRREKKKAAKRRREHQVLEEKALPQLPVDSPSELPAKDGPSFPSPLNVRATGGDVASPIPGSAATAGNINSPANVGGADPAARQPHSASLVDYKSRQLPLINNSTPVAEKTPLSARNEPSSARADMPLAKQLQLGTASAPVSPMGADKPMPAPIQVTELQPPIPVIPPLDPGLEAGLTWTEDIGALENNFIRLSTRNSIRQKNSDSIASSIAASLNTKNGAGGGHAQPGDNGGSDNDAWYKSGSTPSSASKPRADIQASMQRTRTTSSSDNMRSMVPPGLRSRDSTPVDGFARGVPEKGDAGRPHTRTGTEKAFELEGKEWLDNASVAQLKEELLVNYGQLCRMEISFQRLREHYTTVVNQLVDTRQSLMQERAKRMEYENILRNYYGYIDESPLPESSAKFATGQQRGGNNSPAPVDKDGKPGASTKANGRAMGKHKEGALSAAQIGRSLSIRRQKPAKPQQQASSAQDHNDSGSDAEDAIITTVPQKATKRFIWPFGGSRANGNSSGSSHHHHQASSASAHTVDIVDQNQAHGGRDSESMSSTTLAGGANAGTGASAAKKSNEEYPHAHSFHSTSTFRPGKCDHCQERLRKFTNSVVRCRYCGFVCHQRCAQDVSATCTGHDGARSSRNNHAGAGSFGGSSNSGSHHHNLYPRSNAEAAYDPNAPFQPNKMFGRSLSEQTQLEGQDVPWVVRACVQFIEAEGLTLEGVYRKSGSSTDIRMIQIHISQVAASTNSKFFDTPIATPDTDVTSVTSVLKQYFRDLPNPLLTFETYHLWVQASNIASVDERIKVYRTISDSMPRAHSETLKFLMAHLKNISDSHQDNKMTTNNLSVVFAPNILHMPKSNVLEEMANMSGINQTVKFLIQYAEEIWGDNHYLKYGNSSGGRNNASAANDNVSPTYSLQQQPTSSPTSPIQGSASIDSDGMPLANGINDAVGSLSSAMENASLSHSMPSPMGYMSQFMSKNSGPPGAQEKDPYRKQIARNSNLNGGRTQASFDFPRD